MILLFYQFIIENRVASEQSCCADVSCVALATFAIVVPRLWVVVRRSARFREKELFTGEKGRDVAVVGCCY